MSNSSTQSIRNRAESFVGGMPTNHNFLKLLFGRVLTNIGDSLYTVAAMWLVFDLTQSTFFTGIAGFLTRLPPALQFLTGPVVDRYSVRSILIWTQALQAVVVLVVPLASLFGLLSVWVVLTVIPALSLLNQFVYPAQNSALPRVVEKEKLVRANSLFDVAYRGSNILFNALAGGIIAVIGAVSIYVVDSITFAIAVFVFVSLTLPGRDHSEQDPDTDEDVGPEADVGENKESDEDWLRSAIRTYLTELVEGFDVIRGSLLVSIVVVAAVTNFTLGMMRGVLPAFAELRGGVGLYGLILAGLGVGQLTGSAIISATDNVRFGRATIVGFAVSATTWVLGTTVEQRILLVVLLGFAYLPIGAFNVVMFAAVQSAVPDELIGRTTSVLTSAGVASVPIGMAVGGTLGETLGVQAVMTATGLGLGFVPIYFALRPKLRELPAVNELDTSSLEL